MRASTVFVLCLVSVPVLAQTTATIGPADLTLVGSGWTISDDVRRGPDGQALSRAWTVNVGDRATFSLVGSALSFLSWTATNQGRAQIVVRRAKRLDRANAADRWRQPRCHRLSRDGHRGRRTALDAEHDMAGQRPRHRHAHRDHLRDGARFSHHGSGAVSPPVSLFGHLAGASAHAAACVGLVPRA